jgi:YfiH family protein
MSVRSDGAGLQFLAPDWAAPRSVRAAFTLRRGGVSAAPFDSLNVAAHVGDDREAVAENRRRLRDELRLAEEPAWMEQVHGTEVLNLDMVHSAARAGPSVATADAALTRREGHVCVVQVADCLPVLFAARDGSAVAAAHAGWRGLAAGVLEATVKSLAIDPGGLLAWIGPGIGPAHFEVGDEVRRAFLAHDTAAAGAFTANARRRWQCDLPLLARARLAALGLAEVTGGTWCTYDDASRFFSFRRDGRCGRMAAVIWLAE